MAAYSGMAICAVMILFNLAKFKRRGWAVLWMACAFAAFGLILNALVLAAPEWQIYVFGFFLALGLVGDAFSKIGKAKETPKG